MTLLSRKTDYALLILSCLHGRTVGACAREIADQFGLSRSFTANILKELCQKGFVVSQRGVKGGYLLQRPAHEISLAELLTAIEDGFQLAACNHPSHDVSCTLTAVCPIKQPIAEVHRRLTEVLQSVMLTELFPVGSLPHTSSAGGSLGLPMLPPIAATATASPDWLECAQ